ncbi:DegT/DnrJ/EryC1/StrS family aminotransferase [Rhodoflexus caldus]|uniref:DegT/DnrJ/EryC1/StrS family aminotransferase n=1 Tax=Rhodoflexus caldus TaxID=2891236 RepID=UPI00202A9664|nr:DegT/DnrJ/EryC1/StrS family aminotransferase [Rhodoflexus caldus]
MIPVFEPEIADEEKAAVADALARGEISGSFGRYIPDFERAFADYCGMKHGVAVSSGTTALQLAVRAAGIGKGDEVLLSASTNIATALAVIYNGAIPVPVDSEALTWNLDLDLLESKITPRTKAVIPVHLYGHPVDMDRLMEIANRHNLIVIEDAAEAHGAEVRGKKAGSFGHMNCFSFYANKIITTGEGGMVLTNDDRLADQLRLLRNLAFTKPRFRHEVAGYNFRMTGMQAAMGLAQTRKLDRIISQKIQMAAWYNQYLADIPGLTLPHCEPWAKHVYWMYGILIDEKEFGMNRDTFAEKLYQNGIETRTFFCPMNLQPCLQATEGFRQEACPVAEKLWETGLYLPSSHSLSEETIARIAQVIRNIRP